jgi:uncharacterized protein YjbI with pentapeptide repeats
MRSLLYIPPQTKAELLYRYAHGERYFAYIELPEQTDLSGVMLDDAVFDYGILSDINFQQAQLRHVSFRSTNLKCTDFRYSILTDADFSDASIESIYLAYANIEGAMFFGATFCGITVTHENQQRVIDDLSSAAGL